MTTGDIAKHLSDVYETGVSRELVSKVPDAVIEQMTEWQHRPLDAIYPVLLIDASCSRSATGRSPAGRSMWRWASTSTAKREVLGLWVGPSGGEGAKQWMNMLTELRNRGILDVCTVCCDGLKGLPAAIAATWSEAVVQTCVVHLVRNSLRYASKADWQKIAADLKSMYTSSTVTAAQARFGEFCKRWGAKYPAMISMWKNSWGSSSRSWTSPSKSAA